MKIIQINGGFTQKELEAFRPVIYNNLISQMKVLVNAAERLGIPILEYNKVCIFHSLLLFGFGGARCIFLVKT